MPEPTTATTQPAPRWTVGPGRALIFDGAAVAFVDIPPYPATYYPHELDALTRATVDALNAANVDGSAILRPAFDPAD